MSLSKIIFDGSTTPVPDSWINVQANKVYCNELDILGSNVDFETYQADFQFSLYNSSGALVTADVLQKEIKFLRIGDFVQIFIPAFGHTAASVYNYIAFTLPVDLRPATSKACTIISELNSTVENSLAIADVGGQFRFYKNFARANFAISDLYDVSSQTLIYNL